MNNVIRDKLASPNDFAFFFFFSPLSRHEFELMKTVIPRLLSSAEFSRGFFKQFSKWRSGLAELANAWVVHPRDPGSNFLDLDLNYFLILFVSRLNIDLQGVDS
jgi:hypothetical protein